MRTDLFTRSVSNADGYGEVAPAALAPVLGEVRVLDVREATEFHGELSHIPGAELVPLGSLEHTARDWDRDTALVIVCRTGRRSGSAAASLARLGFRHVLNLRGGMLAYNQAGLPLARNGA